MQDFYCGIVCDCGYKVGKQNLEKPVIIVDDYDVEIETAYGGSNLICPRCNKRNKVVGTVITT